MNHRCMSVSRVQALRIALFVLCWALPPALAAIGRAGEVPATGFPLVKSGNPACKVVVISGTTHPLLMTRAADAIVATVQRWVGVTLPVTNLPDTATQLPPGPSVVLATLDQLRKIAPEIVKSSEVVKQVASEDEEGFAYIPIESGGEQRIFVVGPTPRGVYNGAEYAREFLMDGEKESLYLESRTVVRSPQMPGRPIYMSSVWGNEDEYTANDWMKIIDSFARDGSDRIYFWLSGHFPSKKFPQTYKVSDKILGVDYDSTTETGIGTLEDERRIIRYAHEMGLKFYIGAGLGGWVGTRFLTNLDKDTLKVAAIGDSGEDQSTESLCPSNPRVHDALVGYFTELIDSLPDADGFYIESADEMGACQCPICSKPIDNYGSKQFGQSQLNLIQDIMEAAWRHHPGLHLAYSIGYPPHNADRAYYARIRNMNDPRFEFMESRETRTFPGPQGQPLPPTYFSRKMVKWEFEEATPFERLVEKFNREGREGWYGAALTFSPGFSSGSFYTQIPFPTDRLPYLLTSFVYRELSWEPTLTVDDLKERIQQRFFGKEAPAGLASDFWEEREVIRRYTTTGYDPGGEREEKASYRHDIWGVLPSKKWGFLGCTQPPAEVTAPLAGIEQHANQARSGASPKTLESLDMMTGLIADFRKACK